MPHLPTLQDSAEAALYTECWEAVLCYADLCTSSGSRAASRLATEAFALVTRETRAAEAAAVRGTGRRAGTRLPVIPLLLTAVRTTAAGWEAGGLGHLLDPDLRLWLESDQAARYTGPPLQRPIALRGLRDMREPDASLLWLAEVEALPLTAVARRLGIDPATTGRELDQVRDLFRDRCHRAHLDTPMEARCRGYARLLAAVSRTSAAALPDDLFRHLATCECCAEAAACLRRHDGALPTALADGVLGWGGSAYLERRRRAADVRGAGRPAEPTADTDTGEPKEAVGRTRVVCGGLMATAVLLSGLALGVSMMPLGGSGDDAADARDDRRTLSDPGLSLPSVDPLPSSASATASAPTTAPAPTAAAIPSTGPTGSRTTVSPRAAARPDRAARSAPGCRVGYDLVSQWPGGFQATVTVTTPKALTGWQVSWSFRDGQRTGRTWDASAGQLGSRVTATAPDYDPSVAAGGTLTFGFLGTWSGRNSAPYDFTLNGSACTLN
ncbi:cellulose binding domain-containing protein [Streptomyces sp. NPDC086787]|uniref:cellulose binding domain-containing protein n=1 Tax=Streptomyces sp. NPDC086787 TaxID=3365759 RepID=UPI00380B06E5